MGIVPSTSSKSLIKDTTFSKYLLIVDSYLKLTELYGMKNITNEEFMEKLDIFQATFGKIDEFG